MKKGCWWVAYLTNQGCIGILRCSAALLTPAKIVLANAYKLVGRPRGTLFMTIGHHCIVNENQRTDRATNLNNASTGYFFIAKKPQVNRWL